MKLLNKSPEYDMKQFDGEASVTLELWSSLSLALLSDPFWPGLVAPKKVLSMDQIKLFDF